MNRGFFVHGSHEPIYETRDFSPLVELSTLWTSRDGVLALRNDRGEEADAGVEDVSVSNAVGVSVSNP